MPNLPPGTMIVYEAWLYLGLLGCAAFGIGVGLIIALTFFDRRCIQCHADDYRNGYLSQDEEL